MKLRTIFGNMARFALNSEYRSKCSEKIKTRGEKLRLSCIPRFTAAETNILGRPVKMVDTASFLYIFGEVFEREIYRFKAATESPRIIDGGANIGLSTIYMKQLYPQSHITAFEPDEAVYNVLKENMATFGFEDVECIRKALWNSDTSLDFLHEGADGGRFPQAGDTGRISHVPAVSLRPYLRGPVDFLKLDVEGAETEVLQDCEDLLCNVEYLFVEYHSFANKPQTLNRIIDIMAGAGFRLHVLPSSNSPQPFYKLSVHFGMDMQLNIFGFRER